MSEKIKVLCLFDYCCATGFAQVSKNIMQQLDKTGLYEFTVIGINYDPGNDIDMSQWPGKVKPAVTVADMGAPDVYGRQRLLNELGKGDYDILFMIQDTFIVQTIMPQIVETRELLKKKFTTILYYPFDSKPKNEWVEQCVADIDFPVPYTGYAERLTLDVDVSLKDRIRHIYHGTNLKDFYPIKDEKEVADFRKQYFMGEADDVFLITNINRNQPRKNVFANFEILKELRDRGHDNAKLYLHMHPADEGGNLFVMADHYGFRPGYDFIVPNPRVFTPNQGLPIDVINRIYNASDVVLTTTLGEGWGLSITEAMATKTPIIGPDNTSLTEMMADNRGYLVPTAGNVNLGVQDNERVRPLIDVKKAADAIEKVMNGELPDVEGAYKWAKDNSWDNVCKDWKTVFIEAYKHTQKLDEDERRNPSGLSRQQRRAKERAEKKKGKVSI